MNDAVSRYLFSKETLYFYKKEKEAPEYSEKVTVQEEKPVPPSDLSPIDRTETPVFSFSKPLLVIVNQPDEAEQELMKKILQSVKHSLDSIQLFDISSGAAFPSDVFFSQQITRKVLSFGVAMSRVDPTLLVFPYQKKIHRDIEFVVTDSLSTINMNAKDEKRMLWAALKEMFM